MKQLLKKAKYIFVFVLAVSYLGCEDVENLFPTVTSAFTYTVNEDTGTVTFINISEDAKSYLWNFGDGTTSTEINPVKSYAESGTYTVTLKASNEAGASDTTEDSVTVTIPDEPIGGGDPEVATSLPIDFESNETLTGVFEEGDGVTGVPIANPDQSGINTSDTVYEFTKATGAAWYSGLFQIFPSDIDLSTTQSFTFKIWSPKAGINVRLQLEKEGGGPVTYQIDQTLATADEWVSLTYDFTGIVDPADGYDKIVIFPDYDATNETAGDGSIYYIDDIEQGGTAGGGCTDTALELPIDFDCSTITYDFVTFNGASFSVVDNPQLSGVNDVASKVGEIVNIGGAFEGGAFTLDTPVDFTTDKAITMKFYSTVAVPVLLKFEGAGAPVETTANHGGTGWEQLTFVFTTSDQFGTLVLFVDGPGTTAGTFYMDDIEQVADTSGNCTDTALELPIDFDCSTIAYDFVTFNGASYSVVDNPQLSGVNDVASKVGEIVNIGAAFEGGAFTLDTPVDFSTDKDITMKFYSTVAVPVLLKFEGAGAPVETTANHGGTGWEQLTFSFTTSDQFGTLVLFVDGPGTTAGTFYMDDIEQVAGTGGGGSSATFPLDFEDNVLFFNAFEGATVAVIDNPQSNTDNSSSKVLEMVKPSGAPFFAGINSDPALNGPSIDLANGLAFNVKIWSPKAGINVRMRLEQEPGVTNPPAYEIFQTVANANEWVTVTFDFSTTAATASDVYTRLVLNTDWDTDPAGGETYYIDDIEQVTPTPPASLELPITFDDPGLTYNFATFNGASYSVVDNPQLSGVNNVASKVGEIVNVGGAFEGGAFTLDTPVDFATDKDITMKFYSTVAVPILLKFEGAGAPIETTANHSGGGWEQLTFSFTSSAQFGTLVLFVDGPGTTAGTFYMDDIEQVAGTGGGGGTLATFPLDFEDDVLFFNAFEGATVAVIDNPQSNTDNSSSKVLEMVKPSGAPFFAGINSDQALNGPSIDLSNGLIFKVKVWSPKAGINVRMRLEQEPGVTDPPAYEIFQTLTNANEWVTLTFDFTSQAMSSYVYTRLVLNTDWDTDPAGGEIYYIDDITQE